MSTSVSASTRTPPLAVSGAKSSKTRSGAVPPVVGTGTSTSTAPNKPTPSSSLRPSSHTARARKTLSSTSSFHLPSQTKAPSHGINTNPSAHPRTDPLAALSVLLKLLTSLPGRIGGCAYKLTPAEHALSLHLVGILDPFVFHGVRALGLQANPLSGVNAPPALLTQQPTEILDAILSHVDARKDLLNLGLGCKRLWEVVSPRHLEYRVVRCKVSSVAVWHHLVRHRDLARNVRRLEIIDERAPSSPSNSGSANSEPHMPMRIPKGIRHSDTDLDSTDDELALHVKHEKYLCAALLRMTALREFRWACAHSPVRLGDVWGTLLKVGAARGLSVVGGLREMVVCDNMVFQPGVGMGIAVADESSEEEEESEEEESEDDGMGGGVPASAAESRKKRKGQVSRVHSTALPQMESVIFRSTPHTYGAAKQPELRRIATMLHQCVGLKNLEITYIPPRSPGSPSPVNIIAAANSSTRTRPVADEFLLYGRWTHLTTLTLTNLRCTSPNAASAFLSAHTALEVLHFDISLHAHTAGQGGAGMLHLKEGSLPRLREIKACKEVINAVLECPCSSSSDSSDGPKRPLEVVKGFKLSGHHHPSTAQSTTTPTSTSTTPRTLPDAAFLSNLRMYPIKRIELVGWHDMEDVRNVVRATPRLTWLDVGRRLGGSGAQRHGRAGEGGGGGGPVANLVEWTEVLGALPELGSVHGVRFFYEVAGAAVGVGVGADDCVHSTSSSSSDPITLSTTGLPATSLSNSNGTGNGGGSGKNIPMSMMERSRMRKNDEIAGVLAWKCRKLRRVDHWEEGGGKVVVLLRDESSGGGKEREGKVRWEVRRVKC